MKVAIYVQHFLGSGHLVRMQLLANALHNAGHNVTLISGGKVRQAQPYHVVQLPILKTRVGDFGTLLDQNEQPVNAQWKQQRRDLLLRLLAGITADIVLIETWPFGRRQLEFEIVPMVEMLAAQSKPPLLVASIRDVLQQRKLKTRLQTLANLQRYFSMVLVHGQHQILPLQLSFEEAEQIACKLKYTGYIASNNDSASMRAAEHNNEALVSVGGGAAGSAILQAAIKAACIDPMAKRNWRILVGTDLDATAFAQIKAAASGNTTVETNRPDFPELLRNCMLSVSQFGYNTALDLVAAGCPAVVIPFVGDGESEQLMRATHYAAIGRVVLLSEQQLNSASLLAAAGRACALPLPAINLDLNGAANSVRILEQHLAAQ